MVPLLATSLLATVGCSAAASPTPSTPGTAPSQPPASQALASPAPSAVPPTPASVAPSAQPSASGQPTIGLAPAGPWSTVGWIDAGKAFPLTAPAGSDTFLLNVYGWSGGYVAFAGDAGSYENPGKPTLQVTSSTDGVEWSAPKPIGVEGFDGELEIVGVAESPGGLVAIGEYPPGTCGGPDTYAGFWHSKDGATWTRVREPAAMAKAAVSSLNGGPTGFIATGTQPDGTPVVFLSPDGATWNSSRLPTVSSGRLVIDDGFSVPGGLVLSGAILQPGGCGGGSKVHPAVWWSADGATWTETKLPNAVTGPDVTLWVRTLADGGLVAIEQGAGDSPYHDWVTADGRTWKATPSSSLPFDLITDGRHAIATQQSPNNDGPWTINAVGDDLGATTVRQSGAVPSEADNGGPFIFAVGPTGLIAIRTDGTSARLGVPGT
jgi:hypothetical protein